MKRVLIFIMLISMILTNGVFTQSIVIEAEDQQTSLLLVQEDITLTEDKEVDELLIKQGTLDLNGHTLKVKGEAIHEGGTLSVHGGSLQVAGDYRLQSKISENTYTSGEGTILMADNADSIIVHGDFITESSISSDGNITKGILEVKGNITQLDTVISDNLVMTGISLLKLSGTVKQHINLCSAGAANSKFANLLIENEQGIELDSDIYVSGNINDNNYPVTGKTVYVSKEATFSNHSFNGSVHLKGLSEETDFLQKVGGNLIVEESSINLSADLVVGGSLTIKNGELFLKGYTVTVEKDTIFDNSTIKLDHGKYYTKENMTLQGNSCSMIMFFSDDYVFVGGNYVIESLTPEYTLIGYSKQNTFYAGKLEIKGNMIEQCKSEAAAFITGANHTTIFSGEKYQKVIEETGRIQFGKVIVTNTSDEGIYVPKGFRYTTSLTLNEIKYTTDAVEKRGWTLKRDEEYNGDFCLSEGTLKLNGHSLKINGNLIQSGGTLIVDGGDLEVGGDYRIQTQKGTGATVEYDRSNGELYMTSDEDYVLVGGSFITASNYTGKLLAGIMEIKGNIQVLSPYRFEPKENHTMILSGETSQSIDLGDDLSASIFNIELKNTSKAGVIFEHTPTLSGNINFNQTPVSVSAICITDTTSFTDDEYEGNIITKGTMSLDMLSHIRGNLTVTGKVTLGKTLIVDGGLAIKNGSLSLGTNECRVLGDVVSDGGTLDISDGSMYCKKRLQAKRIEMKDSGFLLVEGDFFVSTSECRGTVELKGNFTEQGEDKVYISTVKLSGEKLQTINFISDNSYFDKVEFYNTSREGVYSETGIHCPNINTNNTVYRTGCNGRKGWILTEDEVYTGDFYLQSDILDLNGHTLTVNGNLYQLNGKIKFNGGTLIVNGDFRQETFFEMNGTTVQKAGWGNIYMNTSESNLFIRGDFIVGTHGGTAVDNGTLELKGSLLAEQANNSSSFVLCEGANIIFSGEMVQLISCRELKDKYSTNIRLSGNTYFKNSMDNGIKIVGYGVVAEGRIISNDKHIDGWLQMKETASFEKKYFCGNVMSTYSLPSDILNNEFIIKGDLYVNDDLCFKEKLVVEGNITCEQCNSTFTKSLEVYGDFITKNYAIRRGENFGQP